MNGNSKRNQLLQPAILLVSFLFLAHDAHAQKEKDIIWPRGRPMVSGKIESVSADAIKIKEKNAVQTIPVDEIARLRFGDEPAAFARVRTEVANGQIEQAGKQLEKVKSAGRDFVKQDIEFYKALVAAQLALKGNGDVTTAAKRMNRFLDPTGLRYYKACEVMGDLAMSLGKFKHASSFYSRLTKSKSDGIEARGYLLQGDALLMQGEPSKALSKFQQAADGSDPRVSLQGKVGVARCMAMDGKADEAIEQLEKLISQNTSKDIELFARAYNALGFAFAASGNSEAALDSYLHTDLLFYGETNQHAEALYHLSKLWTTVKKPAEADRARLKLKQAYKASLWAKK